MNFPAGACELQQYRNIMGLVPKEQHVSCMGWWDFESLYRMQEGKVKKIIWLQAWFRGQRARNQVRKLAKALFTRKHIIRELVQTEERYIRDLSTVTSDFKAALLRRGIINRDQSLALFSNIEEIRNLNELFFATIFSQAEGYSHYKIIFDKVEKEVHFFKLYFEYFNNFPQSNALVATLTKDSKEFAEFVNAIRVNPKYSQLGLSDYLIKPVQRLPKYVLVMKELRRVTPPAHPDLENIEKVLHMFQKVNSWNNEKLNQVVNRYKISQIERNLHLDHITSEPGVEFVLEEPVSLLSMEGELIESTLYLLTTELIVSKRSKNKERLLANVPFRHGGEVMSNEEHFYYKNSFTVQNGQGDSVTLVFPSEEEKDLLLQKIYNQIVKSEQRNLQKLNAIGHVKSQQTVAFLKKLNQWDLLPEVEVLGTEERNDALFKYTIYIIEVKIKSIRQKIFLRFSQLLGLQQLAQSQGIIIKNQLIKTTWLLNHQPRKIEERKMNIQRFLKELLSKQEVVERGSDVLAFLGLPQQFYKLPSYHRDVEDLLKRSEVSERSTNSQEEAQLKRESKLVRSQRNPGHSKSKRYSIFSSIPEIRQQLEQQEEPRNKFRTVSIQDILQANEISMGHFTRLSQKLYRQSQREKEICFEVLIPWLESEKGFVKERIAVAEGQKIYFLIEKLAQQLQLKYFKDFRLYLERDYFSRLLDDDECLVKVADEVKAGKYLLVLKKMIYLTEEMEEREIRTDRVRLKIIASQAIYDCKKDKYILTYHSILKLSALIGLAQLYRDASPSDLPPHLDAQALSTSRIAFKTRQMVANDFTSFYDGSKAWESDYEKIVRHLYDKIRGISRQNSQTFRQSKVRDNEREYNTTNMGQLAAIAIIYEIKQNAFYGSISFIVQMSQEFSQVLLAIDPRHPTDNRNSWLVIKYHQIALYSISLADQLFTVHYDDIHRMVSYPASIEIYLRGKEVDSIKLKTTSSYSIREIILYYKQYNEMIRKMDENQHFEESILELVREQGTNQRESIIHRGTVSEFFLC